MLDQGIIWNQHLDSFRKNRECFQNALRSRELARGSSLAREATCRWISTLSHQWEEAGLEPLQNHRHTGFVSFEQVLYKIPTTNPSIKLADACTGGYDGRNGRADGEDSAPLVF